VTQNSSTDGTKGEQKMQKLIELKLKVEQPIAQNVPDDSEHIVWTYLIENAVSW